MYLFSREVAPLKSRILEARCTLFVFLLIIFYLFCSERFYWMFIVHIIVDKTNKERCNFDLNIRWKIIALVLEKKKVSPFLQKLMLTISGNCTNVQNWINSTEGHKRTLISDSLDYLCTQVDPTFLFQLYWKYYWKCSQDFIHFSLFYNFPKQYEIILS